MEMKTPEPSYILLDNNVWIDLFHRAESGDFSFCKALYFFASQGLYKICYSNYSLIELAQGRNFEEVEGKISMICEIPNLQYFNLEDLTINPSSRSEFLNNALHTLKEYAEPSVVRAYEKWRLEVTPNYVVRRVPSKRSEELKSDISLKKFITSDFREKFNIKKGEFNHLSLSEFEEVVEQKYAENFKLKQNEDGSFRKFFEIRNFEEHTKTIFDEYDLTMIKYHIFDVLGYRSKSLKKISFINSAADSFYVTAREYVDFIVTDDKDLNHKINTFEDGCHALSCSEFRQGIIEAHENICKAVEFLGGPDRLNELACLLNEN